MRWNNRVDVGVVGVIVIAEAGPDRCCRVLTA
jgi:hypothetical protein